jgi:two-component system sensor histidine kinase KdpD
VIAPRARQWLLWFAALALAAMALLAFRAQLNEAHIALVFLLVVLGGSAAGGRLLGVTLALSAFLVFDVGFLPPYATLVVANVADWIVLLAFLATGLVAAELLERARRETALADSRTVELDRLATLGAETLNAPRPDDALRAIAAVIAQAMATDRCEIVPAPGREGDLRAEPPDRDLPARERILPLAVRGRVVGTLHLGSDRPFRLTRDQERVLGTLSYYAALGVERVRLAASADEAEALRRADRYKDALLASISHDLRTPLTAIKGIANEIARGEDPSRAYVIEEEADRLTELVNDLLDLSQLSAGEVRSEPALNTADDVVGSALQRVEPAYPDRRFVAELGEPWVELVGWFDFVQTMRILTNLLENAARYAPAGTCVRLVVRREQDTLSFAVEDDGPGIPVEERDRIFEPFVRGASHRAGGDATRGTGLGLTIARRLAEAQGGRLEYRPTPGTPSRFVLSLPAVSVDAG